MIPIVKPFIPEKNELIPELEKVIYSGYIAQGEMVERFENELNKILRLQNVLSLNSGSSALTLAFHIIGINENDEIISTAMTAEPTNTSIALTKGKLVFADVNPNSGNLTLDTIQDVITEKTRVVVLVHYAGIIADFVNISEYCRSKGIYLIVDAAHCLGGDLSGFVVGDLADFTIFSFQAIKHLTTIDGGALVCRSDEDHQRAKLLRWFGLDKTIDRASNMIKEAGFKFHMNDVNATFGLVALRNYHSIIRDHISNGVFFDETLKSISGINSPQYLEKSNNTYWLYTALVEERDSFIKAMISRGINVSTLHKRNDKHPLFKTSWKSPGLDEFYSKFIHWGSGPWIKAEEREKIKEALKLGW